MNVAIACGILLACFAINLPVFIGVLTAILSYFFLANDASPIIAVQRVVGAGENITLLAIPFFVMLGHLLNHTGITRRMLHLAEVLMGHFSGGLAHANVLLSTMMGGMSASNLADCAMLTKMLVPEMTRLGYNKAYSAAITAAGSLITPIIPPGIALIIYGYVADVSIGKMFMAGVIPGLLCCLMLMLSIGIVSKKRGYKPARPHGPSLSEVWVAFKDCFWGLLLVVVIIGGIRMGVFTPTEAGAIAVVYAIIVGMFVYKEMKFSDIKVALTETARSTAGIMLIIMACSAFAWLLTWEQVAQGVAVALTTFSKDPWVFLLMLNVLLLILGMFIEGNAAIIVLVPLLMPTVRELGIDQIQFGIIMILNLAIGCMTPPMGTVMFISTQITGISVREFVKEMWPSFWALMITLALVTIFPSISTFLPNF